MSSSEPAAVVVAHRPWVSSSRQLLLRMGDLIEPAVAVVVDVAHG